MKNRQYSLDFIKVVATIFIIFHHYQQFVSGIYSSGINYYGGTYNFGYMVELFFILSGYFMYPYIEKIKNGLTLKSFFVTRYIRLIPLVAVVAFIYQFISFIFIKLFGATWFMYSRDLWSTLVAALGFQEGWVFPDNAYVNYPVWYVSVLLVCYIVLFLVTYLSKMLHVSSRYFYLAAIFLGISIATYGWNFPFMNIYNARGYYSFFTGVLLSTYYYEKETSSKETILSLCITLSIIGLIVFKYNLVGNGIVYICSFILFPAVILLFKSSIVCKLFSSKVYQTLAGIAFNAYLWQMPLIIIVLIIANSTTAISFLTRESMWCFTIINFLVGTASYYLLEKNINKLLTIYQRKKQ